MLAVLADIFDVEVSEFNRRRHGSPLRAVASTLLIRYAGLSQCDVADFLNIGSGSAVCSQLKALPGKLVKDRHLRLQMKQAEAGLEKRKAKKMMRFK